MTLPLVAALACAAALPGCGDDTLDHGAALDVGQTPELAEPPVDAAVNAALDGALGGRDSGLPSEADTDAATEVAQTDIVGDGDQADSDAAEVAATDSLDAADAPSPVATFSPQDAPVDAHLFDLGVQSGDPLPDGVILWTHLTGRRDEALRVKVFGAPGDDTLYLDAPVPIADGGYARLDARGLLPATRYRYCFTLEDPPARSVVGTFRSAPAPDAMVPVTFGAMSGTKQLFRPFHTLSRAAEADLDLFLLLGDTAYNDGADTLEAYRARWFESLTDEGYRALTRSTSFLATWDDHEISNNWDPETIDPAKLEAGTAAFFETIALRTDPAHPRRLWRTLRWGQTADFFVLDCRSERLPSTRHGDNAQYISPEQMAWLGEQLHASTAVFKFILNSVPITDMPLVYPGGGDRWEGYAAARDEVLALVAGVPGVFWLSADVHFPAIAHVGKHGAEAAMWEMISGPGGNLTNPGWVLLTPYHDQFPYVGGGDNYFRFTADPLADPPTLTVEIIDNDGAIKHAMAIAL